MLFKLSELKKLQNAEKIEFFSFTYSTFLASGFSKAVREVRYLFELLA